MKSEEMIKKVDKGGGSGGGGREEGWGGRSRRKGREWEYGRGSGERWKVEDEKNCRKEAKEGSGKEG